MAKHITWLHYLLDQYIAGRHTPEELTEFWRLIDNMEDANLIREQIMAWWHSEEGVNELAANIDPACILERILRQRRPNLSKPLEKRYQRMSVRSLFLSTRLGANRPVMAIKQTMIIYFIQ